MARGAPISIKWFIFVAGKKVGKYKAVQQLLHGETDFDGHGVLIISYLVHVTRYIAMHVCQTEKKKETSFCFFSKDTYMPLHMHASFGLISLNLEYKKNSVKSNKSWCDVFTYVRNELNG